MLRKLARFFFLIVFSIGYVHSAPKGVEYFQSTTWTKFQSELPKPHIVVFSTTDCGHCPDVVLEISKAIKAGGKKVYLSVVVMDGLSHLDYLLSAPHYLVADKVFAFDGQANAIRHAVNPSWRGLTPYVALIPSRGEVDFILGNPSKNKILNLQKY
jgi:predicted membrane-bound spermidine synthase